MKQQQHPSPVVPPIGVLKLVRLAEPGAPTIAPAVNIRGADDLADFLRPYADRATVETFWVVAIDHNHNVIGGEPIEVAVGTPTTVPSEPRQIFRAAIVAGAAHIAVCHNHPLPSGQGQPEPSDADVRFTRAVAQIGAVLNIPVVDHVIMGPDGHTSLLERGVIAAALEGDHPVSDLVQRGFTEFDALMARFVREQGDDPTEALLSIETKRAGRAARRGLSSES